MTLADLLQHWSIRENPFMAEEARGDAVFARMSGDGPEAEIARLGGASGASGASGAAGVHGVHGAYHSDFEKIVGDLNRPGAAIVFGEKGSGKTAIRFQIAGRIAARNSADPGARVLLVAYDEHNGPLDRLHARVGGKSALDSIQKMRLVDHIDAMLHTVVPRVVDVILWPREVGPAIDLGPDAGRVARRMEPSVKRDLLLLQAVYDRPGEADLRTRALRRRLGVALPKWRWIGAGIAIAGPPALVAIAWSFRRYVPESLHGQASEWLFYGLILLYLLAVAKRFIWDVLADRRLGRRLRKQLRVIGRSDASYARSAGQLDEVVRDATSMPLTDSDDPRYTMLQRLRGVLRPFGYHGIVIVIDRVDEPTLISGDADRMRAFVWPMLNNKFLQQEGVGVKMLLPIELRHALFKESSAFFQEARLDKQGLVERLNWTGPMLYDLCEARLRACHTPSVTTGQPSIALLDLFAEDVTRQDVVGALDQMHQPRDACKFLYRCLTEHCAGTTKDQEQWKIPRHVLEQVRKQESDRVQQLYRGIRPA
ncbi:MAG: hypothetical protein IT436_03995 [Phycisphaerales bacterium]|nr:hypothetical protein [Phycisphaerales bacterium]